MVFGPICSGKKRTGGGGGGGGGGGLTTRPGRVRVEISSSGFFCCCFLGGSRCCVHALPCARNTSLILGTKVEVLLSRLRR